MILLDTHVVVWLAAGDLARIPEQTQDLIERSELSISPIVEVELTYLHEIGRVTVPATELIGLLARQIGLAVDHVPLGRVCSEAASMSWTRDLFDRLIAAHAALRNVPLITKDRILLTNLPQAVWEE